MKPKKIITREERRWPPELPLVRLLPDDVNVFSVTHHDGVARSLRFMTQNYWRPIQLNDLVMVSGMSRRGLTKAFYVHVGYSPGSVLRHMRIESAKHLLLEHDLILRTIAKRCGYRSENTFCIAFQRATGMAPKKFQRHAWLTTCRIYRQAEADSMIGIKCLNHSVKTLAEKRSKSKIPLASRRCIAGGIPEGRKTLDYSRFAAVP
jgi:AraC-like DNA-binding protein